MVVTVTRHRFLSAKGKIPKNRRVWIWARNRWRISNRSLWTRPRRKKKRRWSSPNYSRNFSLRGRHRRSKYLRRWYSGGKKATATFWKDKVFPINSIWIKRAHFVLKTTRYATTITNHIINDRLTADYHRWPNFLVLHPSRLSLCRKWLDVVLAEFHNGRRDPRSTWDVLEYLKIHWCDSFLQKTSFLQRISYLEGVAKLRR